MFPAVAALCAALSPLPAAATCAGTPNDYVCTDASGNHYSAIRYGGSTFVSGSNATGGRTWWRHTQSIGNTTFSDGQANGRGWNHTTIDLGGGTRATYGTDSSGRPYSSICGPHGCY